MVPAGHGNHGQFLEHSDDTLAGVYLNLNLLVQIDGLRFAGSADRRFPICRKCRSTVSDLQEARYKVLGMRGSMLVQPSEDL